MALDDLRNQARAALAAQDFTRCDRLYAEWLALEPESLEALGVLGQRAVAQGRNAHAIERFAAAHAIDPRSATVCANLGVALRDAGKLDDALALLRDAVTLDPQFFIARLHLGSVCEALGRDNEATATYFGAVTTAQAQGRWLGDSTTAPVMRPLVRHAMQVIDRGRAQLFHGLLEPLRRQHGADALRRVQKCLAIYLGTIPADWPDPRQKPSFMYLPDLPSTPWFDRSLFPWYDALESQTPAILDELQAVLAEEAGFIPFLKSRPGGNVEEHLVSERGDAAWDGFFFYRHGERFDDNCRRCPVTAAALDALPLVRLEGNAPECLYSKLTPGSHILPHRGVTNTRVVTHLPLITPGNGALRVGGEDHEWQVGRCITFDDTFLHEAWNRSEQTRVVVLLDVWNPHMTPVEIAAVGTLVDGIRGFNTAARLADPMIDKGHG